MSGSALTLGLSLGVVSAIAYGANIPTARMAALAGVPGADIVFWRGLMLVPVLALVLLAARRGFGVPRMAWPPLIALSAGTAVVGLAYVSSVAFIPVGVATIIFYVYPLIILVASPFIEGDRLSPMRLGVFAVAFVGLLLAVGADFSSLNPVGLGLAAMASLAATVQFFAAAKTTRLVDPLVAGFCVQVAILPVALAVVLAKGGFVPWATLTGPAFWPVVFTALLFQVAFILHFVSAKRTPPAALGLIFCLEPVTSIALATVLLDEWPGVWQIVGGGLVLFAVVAALGIETRKGRPA